MERTTHEHREAVAEWRANAPANDHKIFGRSLKTEKPRHRDLSQLSALLAMRSRPAGVAEGVEPEPVAPIKTNWSLTAANDNERPASSDGFDPDSVVTIVPSIGRIEQAIEGVRIVERMEPAMLVGGRNDAKRAKREIHSHVVGGNVEYGKHVDDAGKVHKVVVRIGTLRFSDGTQTEKGTKLVFGKPEAAAIRMPCGAMLDCRENKTQDRGEAVDASGSNAHFRHYLGAARAPSRKALTPRRGERVNFTKDEAAAMLAAAIRNTPTLPEVKKIPDGLPVGPANLRQLFIGMQKGKKGESGSMAWQDVFTERENRDTYNKALDAMQDDSVRILTEAMSAASLTALGEARGYRGRHAIAAGRRLLIAANDDFKRAMEIARAAAA